MSSDDAAILNLVIMLKIIYKYLIWGINILINWCAREVINVGDKKWTQQGYEINEECNNCGELKEFEGFCDACGLDE
ncbi:MAG: hypothetical protein ACRC7B_03050 [Metamycoplasmataceae bacterium]